MERAVGAATRGDSRVLAPWVVSAVGGVIVLAMVGEWAWLAVRDDGPTAEIVFVQSLFNLGPGVALAYAGAWLRRSDLDAERFCRVLGWCLGGLAVSLATNLVIIAAFPPDPIRLAVGWVRTAAAFGAVAGAAVGIVEARAIERSIAAERARVRADAAERERERLDYLNSLLRHEMLNAVTVIDGQASHTLENGVEGETRTSLETIRRQAGRMTDVVTDVRVLIEATQDRNELEPVDVVSVLDDELTALTDRHRAVQVETDLPPEATVLADDLVRHVFGNLLDNAVEHNDSDSPAVTVTADRTEDGVVVAVADNGPGIDPETREHLFEREGGRDHGLGMYLVDTLVDRYDGAVELTESGPDGTVVTVEMPRTSGEATDAPDRSTETADR